MSGIDGTVIVLNWQGTPWIDRCLTSLGNQLDCPPFEVLVVDNGSTDGSLDIARRHAVKILDLGQNTGFSRGNNAGARVAVGSWLIFANVDMEFTSNFVGRVASTLTEADRRFAVDVAHETTTSTPCHGATRLRAKPFGFDETFPDSPQAVPFANGGALCVRREMFESLGGFDERMFAGSEDLDLCWRARLRGWETWYLPEVLGTSLPGSPSTTPSGNRIRRRSVILGRLVFATKHFAAIQAVREWLECGARVLLHPSLTPAFLSAARHAPSLLRDRRNLYANTRRSEFLDIMMSIR